ncbi:pyridoxamine 5'-phosphate oxidase family protein [Catenulispora pinisilvae]|uniref:pyridoxamine 5'-phosphate oxidase family protein n=1 Tax=Catenulispora pinisilvae TaxID=2705253 RepID=UPI001892180A|nr:pyridoxamine 5'-phosphate oxidase family protein [Catenulispora pinisilvae]
MASEIDGIDDRLRAFIAAQPMYFVASAPLDGGHVNVSPKGYADTFAVLDEHTVAYLDLFGSGIETVAHLRQQGNRRITVMFCSFTRNSKIVRLFGTGRMVRPDTPEFETLKGHFNTAHIGIRAIIVIDVERIRDSCGFAVPYMTLVDERPVLDKRAARRDDEQWADRITHDNAASIDGLPGLDADHPLPSAVTR